MVLGVDRQANKVDLPESALPYRQVVKPRTNKGENVDPVFVAHGSLRFAALGALDLHLYPGNDCPGWVGDASETEALSDCAKQMQEPKMVRTASATTSNMGNRGVRIFPLFLSLPRTEEKFASNFPDSFLSIEPCRQPSL